MTTLRLNDLRQHQDVLRLRNGKSLTVRFVEPRDAEALQAYFRALTTRSRYNRFIGAMRELPRTVLDEFVHVGERDRFSVIATMTIDGYETIVGEARYGFVADAGSFEFGLSIDDRWQGHGIGAALLKNLECRAAGLEADTPSGHCPIQEHGWVPGRRESQRSASRIQQRIGERGEAFRV